MKIYYKYTNLFPLEYFDNPTIKLSPPAFLNDPFEFNASENIIQSIHKYLRDRNTPEDKINERSQNHLATINSMLTFNGIVSFSETPRNSLMWAHYANQHNGMCIGFKKNVLEHIEEGGVDNDFNIIIKTPEKINYDNLRFESDHYFESDYINLSKEATIKHLLKKSDEWIYEKEHRCIIPYVKSDLLLVTNKNATVDHKYTPTKKISTLKMGTPYRFVINGALSDGDIIKTESEGLYKLNKGKIDSVSCSILQLSKDALHLVNIKPESIHSIYFGCNVSNDIIKPYYNVLHRRYDLYKFELSKKRFELIPKLITEDFLNQANIPENV